MVCGCKKEERWEGETIKVGVLFSSSGKDGLLERPLMQATMLGIEEVNRRGGVLGKKVEGVYMDSGSNVGDYVKDAERLIRVHDVSVIFGCGDSVTRKAVKEVVEKHNRLLFYPAPFEGIERSENVVYTGLVPNQTVIPGITWCMNHIGSRFVIVGSETVYSHILNTIAKDHLYAMDGQVLAEYVVAKNGLGVDSIVNGIKALKPDVIFSTIEGSECVGFFRALREQRVYPGEVPTFALNINENVLRQLSLMTMNGDYTIGSYFQTLETKEGKEFTQLVQGHYGKGAAIDDVMESAYIGVLLWGKAVNEAGSLGVRKVLESIDNQSVRGPSGLAYVDPEVRLVYKGVRIGKVSNGNFEVVWDSKDPVKPENFVVYRTPQEWEDLVMDLFEKWGRSWEKVRD